jgi:plastocyanin
MVNQKIWIGIAVGVFFAGLGIGFAILQSTNATNMMMNDSRHMQMMMNDPQTMQQFHSMMMNDPEHMQKMMSEPQHMQKMTEMMKSNPQTMNQWMSNMMNEPQLRQQMYDTMFQNQQFMQGMMSNQQFQSQWGSPMMGQVGMGSGMMGNWNDPQTMNEWMNQMMSNPQTMQQWHDSMMQNPQFMNRWMSQMMNDHNFQQQYMGPWLMMRDSQFMHGMMNQYSQQYNAKDLAVKTNNVSILSETWQYQSTKSYSPEIIEVSVGTTVTWTNNDVIIHTVTDLGGKFDSEFIQPDETWKYTFDSAGTYYYYCTIHPWMKGAVIAS